MKIKVSYPFLEGGYLEHLIVDNVERVEESGSDGFGSLFAAGGVRDVLVFRLVLTQFTIGRVADELVGVGDQLQVGVDIAGSPRSGDRGTKLLEKRLSLVLYDAVDFAHH